MNIGSRILQLRRERNVTQEELANRLNVTAAAVSKWENGYTLPDILTVCALADFFSITTDELLGRTVQAEYAVIAAQSEALGRQAAEIAARYGLVVRAIGTDFEAARAAVSADDSIRYLIACFFDGFYGDADNAVTLVSVAPTEEGILSGLEWALEHCPKDGR